jgi:hypothetical protein
MTARTPKMTMRPYPEAANALRRLLGDVRPATPPGSTATASLASSGTLVVGLTADVVAGEDGAPWVKYQVVLLLHDRPSGHARVVLYDGRKNELIRVLEEDVSSASCVVEGSFPLGDECELWCEASLVGEPEVRGTAFAWVVPPTFEWRARRPLSDERKEH